MWIAPTRYPHREGRCYTQLGFGKLLKNLAREQKFTPQQLRNLKALYLGTDFQEYLDEEGIYRLQIACHVAEDGRTDDLRRRLISFDFF